MADDEHGQGKRLSGFRVGPSYEQVGPELGQLHEARHERTGEPALILRPSDRMDWQLQAGWRISLSTHRRPPFVRLRVRRAPRSGRVSKLTDCFVLFTSALRRLEDDARLDAHLTSGRHDGPRGHAGRQGPGLGWAVVTGVLSVMALGGGLWWRGTRAEEGQGARREETRLTDARCPQTPIAYPMPTSPLPNQATAPCKKGQMELNGGCWMLLDRRPPCLEETTAEHQSRCYYPVYKPQEPRPRQSAEP